MLYNQKEAARRQTTKRQVGHGAIIDRIGAALEKETRVNLHRHPIKLEFTGDDLECNPRQWRMRPLEKIALESAATVAPAVGLVDRLEDAGTVHERRGIA